MSLIITEASNASGANRKSWDVRSILKAPNSDPINVESAGSLSICLAASHLPFRETECVQHDNKMGCCPQASSARGACEGNLNLGMKKLCWSYPVLSTYRLLWLLLGDRRAGSDIGNRRKIACQNSHPPLHRRR